MRADSRSIATAAQIFLPKGAQRSLDHCVLVEPSSEALFLSIWRVTEDPGMALDAADRDDVIPIGSGFAGTIPIVAHVGDTDGAGVVVALSTGDDATGDPTAAVRVSFRWE